MPVQLVLRHAVLLPPSSRRGVDWDSASERYDFDDYHRHTESAAMTGRTLNVRRCLFDRIRSLVKQYHILGTDRTSD